MMNISFKKFKRFLERPSHGRRTSTYVHISSYSLPDYCQTKIVLIVCFIDQKTTTIFILVFSLSLQCRIQNAPSQVSIVSKSYLVDTWHFSIYLILIIEYVRTDLSTLPCFQALMAFRITPQLILTHSLFPHLSLFLFVFMSPFLILFYFYIIQILV